ncbi:uncharacterized protein [Asterias amurensis]|uniref:uncharacterized protein isoform X4 n=1 Tax=Asterias amurensis TaxID=7602 RepID=UPI003AB5A31F
MGVVCSIPHPRPRRSGSDLHLRQTMKQTDYHKPPLQDVSPRDIKSTHIYDVQPQMYKKSSNDYYDIRKSPDYDIPPQSGAKTIGGVTRRMKKGEASTQSRPKSWHNPDPSQTRENPMVRTSSIPVAQQPANSTTGFTSPRQLPQRTAQSSPPMETMENLTIMKTFHARTMRQNNTQSMVNLQRSNNENDIGQGFVKRRVSEYISSSTRELSTAGKDKDLYFVNEKKGMLFANNPNFGNVELQPAETYPKVATATQLQSAQQQAFIGRVPDAQTRPESQQQTYSTSQVVSYSTVQMPQRQYASSADIHTGSKYWDENTQSFKQRRMSPTSGNMYHAVPRVTPSPTPSGREPPRPPRRGDSRNKAHQIGEHMKSSSWPVQTNTQESRRNDNNCTPNSVISPTDIPPVKLPSKQDQGRSMHSKGNSISGDSEPYSYESKPVLSSTAAPLYSSQQPGNRDGSVTFPGMSNKIPSQRQSLFTAEVCYVDDGTDGTDTDTSSWFSSSYAQDIRSSQTSYDYPQGGSPPTKDTIDRITEESDPLVKAFESYLGTVSDHQELLVGVNPDESSTGSDSPTHQSHVTVNHSGYNNPQSQTLPNYVSSNEKGMRTSISSLDSHSSSQRVKSPTSRLSSDEEEHNRINSEIGSTIDRPWRNPIDFSTKKPLDTQDELWQKIVLTVDPTWIDKYHDPQDTNVPKKSPINEKLIRENTPGIRSPISPLMMEAVEPAPAQALVDGQPKEITFLKTEGRDSGYEMESDNPFRSQQESPNNVQSVSETFSSDDWSKLDNMEHSGTSILSQLQRDRSVNGDPVSNSTRKHETKVEIKIDRSQTSDSKGQYFRGNLSSAQSQLSRSQPLLGPGKQSSKEARDAFFQNKSQAKSSSGHYHSSSLDLDSRMTGPQVTPHSSFPPWKSESAEEPTSEGSSSHGRSHSYSGVFYPSHVGPSEPRFSRIDEELGGESSESGSSIRSRTEPDRRPSSVSGARNSVKDNRRSTSDPKSLDLPPRKSSSDLRYFPENMDFPSQHQKSKSDSERHRKGSVGEQRHKYSDPSGAIRKSHRGSDLEDKKIIKDALFDFVQSRKGPSRSDGSSFGSQQGGLSGYSSMSESVYSSTASIYKKRDPSFNNHSRDSSMSSQASHHTHVDSGIVSPVEASMWGPQSPKTSPPGGDPKQRIQQRQSVPDNPYQNERTSPVDRARDKSWQRSHESMDDYRPAKKPVKIGRSSSMSQASRRNPDVRDRFKEDSKKGISRTETFTATHARQFSHSTSATLPAMRQHRNSKDIGQQYPTKIAPSVDRTQAKFDADEPPQLPPKQVTYKSPVSSYKVKEAQLKPIAKVQYKDDRCYINEDKQKTERRVSAPPQAVFTFSMASHQSQKRYTSPKTSPTHTTSRKDSPPSHQANTAPWLVAETSPDNFDLPPPPTPPANLVIAELGGDLPPPPPEVLHSYTSVQKEEREVVEEPVTQRNVVSTQAAISFPPRGKQDNLLASPSRSPPTSNTRSQLQPKERFPVSIDLDIDPKSRARSQTPPSLSKSEVSEPELQTQEVVPGSSYDVLDSVDTSNEVPSFQSRITASPTTNRRANQDLDFDDEEGPIEVVEIIQTPTVSPRRTKKSLPGGEDAEEQQEAESPEELVDWVLHSLIPQDSSLRELFKFPEEPVVVENGSRTSSKKMPHENIKKAEPQSPKRSECDVKSLTHALSSSLYLQISPAKALLLTRAKGMTGSDMVHGDSAELRKTKEELIGRIDRKVSELSKEKFELQEEINTLEDLGRQVTDNVKKSCKASSLDKYLMYVGDADRVTKLLLSLSRRLTKVNSVLVSLEGNDDEEQKADLEKMHKDLTNKYEDAKGLKVSIDERHVQISSMLQDHLSTEEYEDFCHFVPMRSRLRIMAQELDDRITLGEEQLQALKDSMKDERSEDERSLLSLDSS